LLIHAFVLGIVLAFHAYAFAFHFLVINLFVVEFVSYLRVLALALPVHVVITFNVAIVFVNVFYYSFYALFFL
jgi:hypothetical protein